MAAGTRERRDRMQSPWSDAFALRQLTTGPLVSRFLSLRCGSDNSVIGAAAYLIGLVKDCDNLAFAVCANREGEGTFLKRHSIFAGKARRLDLVLQRLKL